MSRQGIEPGPPAREASTLEKSHPDSMLIAIWNIYIWARNESLDWSRLSLWHMTSDGSNENVRLLPEPDSRWSRDTRQV